MEASLHCGQHICHHNVRRVYLTVAFALEDPRANQHRHPGVPCIVGTTNVSSRVVTHSKNVTEHIGSLCTHLLLQLLHAWLTG
jgi:hypothetical protein